MNGVGWGGGGKATAWVSIRPMINNNNNGGMACLTSNLKVGRQIFVFSPQIANPQILGFILQSRVRKLLRCASPQICKEKSVLNFECSILSLNL